MMVVILTPVDGIIRWLPRGFSCSPATGVVTDKGVPQSDSFAKYAVVDSIGQRNSHVKTCSCGGLLNETNIYSKGKNICF